MKLDRKYNQEVNMHGTYLLPYEIYRTAIPQYFLGFHTHWHEEIELVYVKQGRARYMVDFQEYVIEEGDILIIPPLSLHSFEQYEESEFEAATIIFSQDMVNGNRIDICSAKYIQPIFQNEVYLPICVPAGHLSNAELAQILCQVIEEHIQKKPVYELRIRILFLQFIQYFYERDLMSIGHQKQVSLRTVEQIRQITNYIAKHYAEKIRLEDLAVFANVSVYHLSHIFKKCTGQSPGEYVNDYRLTVAADKLVGEDSQILNIAIDVGYNNISYFNRIFKKKYGVTPKEYRRKHRDGKKWRSV